MTSETEHYAKLPDEIVARLKAREQSVPMLTPTVDRALRDAAALQFASRPPRFSPSRFMIPVAAAAAAALVAVTLFRPLDELGLDRVALADDIDGSGRVDILDVFALARAEQAAPSSVDRGRIASLSDRIVSLEALEDPL